MEKRDLVPGDEYALRERAGGQVQRVKLLEHLRRDKWRVEWVDPNPGLVDYAKSSAIICRWPERRAFLRDEERARILRCDVDGHWPGREHPVEQAVDEVIESAGESLSVYKGILLGPPDAIERVAERASFTLPSNGVDYTDRIGMRRASWRTALALAKAFAAAEPRTVLLHIERSEREYEVKAREPGNAYLLPLVENWRAGWALVRQWASFDSDRSRLEAEIDRLRQLINRAIWDLRRSDPDPAVVASQLERVVSGG